MTRGLIKVPPNHHAICALADKAIVILTQVRTPALQSHHAICRLPDKAVAILMQISTPALQFRFAIYVMHDGSSKPGS